MCIDMCILAAIYLIIDADEFALAFEDISERTFNNEHEALRQLRKVEIRKFVELRNDITHQGVFEWKERADIYAHLYLIFCFSVLERAGIEPAKASKILSWLFSKTFYN